MFVNVSGEVCKMRGRGRGREDFVNHIEAFKNNSIIIYYFSMIFQFPLIFTLRLTMPGSCTTLR